MDPDGPDHPGASRRGVVPEREPAIAFRIPTSVAVYLEMRLSTATPPLLSMAIDGRDRALIRASMALATAIEDRENRVVLGQLVVLMPFSVLEHLLAVADLWASDDEQAAVCADRLREVLGGQ